ncbi:MAG: sensor histidine kinase [Steroidobacter sp.]
MKPRSLRMRLLIGAAFAIFAALAAAWIAMTLLFERHIERRVEAELTRHAVQLVAALSLSPEDAPLIDAAPVDPRFDSPASGLYWQLSTHAGTQRSRSLWDQALPVLSPAGAEQWTLRVARGPFEQELLLLERQVQPDRGDADVLVQLGYDRAALRTASAEFGLELALFLAILWAILSAAAWIQVALGLRPLVRVREEVETLKRNPHERLSAAHALEIEPLTHAINQLADARERDLDRARRRAADLAHGLKTPLAALSAQSRRAREAGAVEAAEGLDRAIAAATAAVERELTRSRAETIRATPAGSVVAPLALIESIVGVVERTEFGARLVFEVHVSDDLRIPAAEEDLMELMGALIENAARFARRRVRISGSSSRGELLSVEDDGPGIDSDRIAESMVRGARLDEAGAGHGLGLAIAHDLAEAMRGELSLERSDLGGLKVAVSWAGKEPGNGNGAWSAGASAELRI